MCPTPSLLPSPPKDAQGPTFLGDSQIIVVKKKCIVSKRPANAWGWHQSGKANRMLPSSAMIKHRGAKGWDNRGTLSTAALAMTPLFREAVCCQQQPSQPVQHVKPVLCAHYRRIPVPLRQQQEQQQLPSLPAAPQRPDVSCAAGGAAVSAPEASLV